MKVAIAFYYKNIEQYPKAWVKRCLHSLSAQTYTNYEFYELDYGDTHGFLTPSSENIFAATGNKHFFRHYPCTNYAAAMNYIYEWIFEKCEVAVNLNIDDYYDPRRIELLLQEIQNGYDIVSSNYHVIDANENIMWSTDYAKKDVYQQFKDGGNPISNPAHLMHRRVFEGGLRFDPSLVPIEDYHFWLKAIEAGFKIKIRPEFLHYYRQHSLQETHRYGK